MILSCIKVKMKHDKRKDNNNRSSILTLDLLSSTCDSKMQLGLQHSLRKNGKNCQLISQ